MKVLFFVLAAVALQALCVSGFRLQDADVNTLDVANKVDRVIAVLPRIGASGRSSGIVGILRRLQSILEGIDRQIEKATTNISTAVSNLLENAANLSRTTVDDWNDSLENIIEGVEEWNSTLTECKAEQTSLQSVSDALDADILECAQNASVGAQTALNQLKTLGPRVDALIVKANQLVEDCASEGFLQGICIGPHIPELAIEAGLIAASAGQLSGQITVEITVTAPAENTVCVAGKVVDRGTEAADIIEAVKQCVQEKTSTTTTTAPTTNAPATASTDTETVAE